MDDREHRAELAQALKSLQLSNTLLQKTQQELIAARWQAERARQMKEQFAANISHELRTPLNLILFGKIMHLSPDVYGDMQWPPTLRHDVHQIYRSSQHLSEMIDDILDLSHFEMAGFSLQRTLVPMSHFLRESASILADLFRASPVPLYTNIPNDLPSLEIDAARIRQVLINLVANAYRHTTQPLPSGPVVDGRTDTGFVDSAGNSGAGIAGDELARIFEQFYQVDSSLSRRHRGRRHRAYPLQAVCRIPWWANPCRKRVRQRLNLPFYPAHDTVVHAFGVTTITSSCCLPPSSSPPSCCWIKMAGCSGWCGGTLTGTSGSISQAGAKSTNGSMSIARAIVANLALAETPPPLLRELKIPLDRLPFSDAACRR